MPNLYPTVNLPTISAPQRAREEEIYKPAPLFDFEAGDFVLDGAGRPVMATGREAYIQWCMKVCVTERNTKMAYSDKIGTELIAATKESGRQAVQSAIIRTITEALMVHPATEYVRYFKFKWDGDHLRIEFRVKGKKWFEEDILTVIY